MVFKAEDVAGILLREQVQLTSYVASIVRDFQAAEDVFQEVCVKAVAAADTFNDRKHLIRWSRVVGRNRALDWVKRSGRQLLSLNDEVLEALAADWPTHESAGPAPRLSALRRCIDLLTANNREIVRLRYFKALSGLEVAEALGRKVETVYQALARIHRRLGECVAERMAKESS